MIRTQREIERAAKFVEYRAVSCGREDDAKPILMGLVMALRWVLGDSVGTHLIDPDAARALYGKAVYSAEAEASMDRTQAAVEGIQ